MTDKAEWERQADWFDAKNREVAALGQRIRDLKRAMNLALYLIADVNYGSAHQVLRSTLDADHLIHIKEKEK